MARPKREIGFWIPWDAPGKVIGEGLWREFGHLSIIVLTCGPSFAKVPKGLTKKKLQRLVEIGWLKWAHNRWWQVKRSDIFPRTAGTKRHWHGAELLGKDARAVLYKMHQDFLQDIQKAPQAKVNQRSARGGRMLNRGSRHNGGNSHSINMRDLKISLGYSAKLRRICECEGLALFKQRVTSTIYDTVFEAKWVYGEKGYFFQTDCGAWEQLASEYVPLVPGRMSVDRGEYKKGGWRKIQKIDQREISNFVTKGAYEH